PGGAPVRLGPGTVLDRSGGPPPARPPRRPARRPPPAGPGAHARAGGHPPRAAVARPLAARPRLRPDGILADNTLARAVEPGGRLHRLLEAVLPPVGAPPPPADT